MLNSELVQIIAALQFAKASMASLQRRRGAQVTLAVLLGGTRFERSFRGVFAPSRFPDCEHECTVVVRPSLSIFLTALGSARKCAEELRRWTFWHEWPRKRSLCRRGDRRLYLRFGRELARYSSKYIQR